MTFQQLCDDHHHHSHCNQTGTISLNHRKKGIRKSYHKVLRCTSGSCDNLPACGNTHTHISCYLPALFMLQSQSSRSLSASHSACPPADSLKKLKSLRKTHKPLFTSLQVSRTTFALVGKKKKSKIFGQTNLKKI